MVVPRRLPLREVEPFVHEKRAWIERTLRRMREAEAELPPPQLQDGGEVRYLGERLTLSARTEAGRSRARVARRGSELHAVVSRPGREPLREALERWYRSRARIEVSQRLDATTARAGLSYAGLQIRGQRTRWASCSPKGAMSFNWRLLLAPPEILDYVVEHEVTHLEVHDHSSRFWSLLAQRSPGYKAHEAWLRRHGPSLRL